MTEVLTLDLLQSLKLSDLTSLVNNVEKELLATDRIPFKLGEGWHKAFESKAGVYAIFRSAQLIYIGESANLQDRMSEVHRTYMHPLRKKLGKREFSGLLVKNKYDDDVETLLNRLYVNEVSFSTVVVPLGRLEIESALIHRYKSQLLNNIGKRNLLNI